MFFASHSYFNGDNFGIFQRQSDIMTICFYPLMERSDRHLTLSFMRHRFNSHRSNGDCLKREGAPPSPLKSKVEVVFFFFDPLHYSAAQQRRHRALSMIISHWLSCCERRGGVACMYAGKISKIQVEASQQLLSQNKGSFLAFLKNNNNGETAKWTVVPPNVGLHTENKQAVH